MTAASQDVSPGGKLTLHQSGSGAQTQAANRVTGGAIAGGLSQNTKSGSTATDMTQSGTGASTQALNMIDSTSADGNNDGSTAVQTTDGAVTMTQSGSAGKQVANYVTTTGAIGATKTFIQKHVSAAGLELDQKTSGSTGDLQAVNSANAGTTASATQDVTAATTVLLDQETGTGTGNTQAVNNVEASGSIATVTQKAQPATSLTLKQSGGGSNTQAANRISSSGTLGTLTQTAGLSGKDTKMTQDGGSAANTQALNMAAGVGSTSATQNAYGVIDMKQGNSSPAYTGSTQAGNYLKSSGTGAVAGVSQNLGSGADNVSLSQIGGTAGSVQAGNLIDVSSGSGALTSSQGITTTGTLSLSQTGSTTKALQAGNAVLTGGTGGGAPTQTAGVGALLMAQTGSDGAFQAVNYVGDRIVGP